MQQWEYLYISCAYQNNGWRPAFANGKEVSGWQTMTIYDYSNELGSEGWELVGLATTDRSSQNLPISGSSLQARSEQTFRLVFKRPKS